jgi:hypothetical protein
MSTLAKTTTRTITGQPRTATRPIVAETWKTIENSRFVIIPMLLIIIGCCGGIAAGFGAGDDAFQLALTSFPTIIALAFVLGVAPMKAIIYLSAAALLLDAFVLLF